VEWRHATDQELEARNTRLRGRSKVCLHAFLASMGVMIGATLLGAGPISDRVLQISIVTLAVSVLGILSTDKSKRIFWPLKLRQDLTDRALKALEHPSARAYRDQVVAHGRELVVGDLSFLEELADRDQVDARALMLHR